MPGGNITLQVYESNDKWIWSVFREHHYLTANFTKSSWVYLVYWNEQLVAFAAFLAFPTGIAKYAFRVHRLVVLPDYQGLGIGTKLLEFFGERFLSQGRKMYLRSTHVRLCRHCRNSDKWVETIQSGKPLTPEQVFYNLKKYKHGTTKRAPYSFEYFGSNYRKLPHQIVVCIGETDEETAEAYLNKVLKDGYYHNIICGVATIKIQTVWEKIARRRGIRTDILFYTSRDGGTRLRKITEKFDTIVIGAENKKLISSKYNLDECEQLIEIDCEPQTCAEKIKDASNVNN